MAHRLGDALLVEPRTAITSTARKGDGLVVIINCDAGTVRQQGAEAIRKMVRRHAPSDLAKVITTDRHDLRSLLIEAAKLSPKAIAVIGGDGTAHTALQTLTPLGVPSVPLPGGTMNRLAARVFGRSNLEQCLKAMGQGRPRALEGGRVGPYSFYVAAGFGAWMQLQSLRERLRKPRGLEGVRAILRMAPRQFEDRVCWTARGGAPLTHSTLVVGVGRIDAVLGLAVERHGQAELEAAGADIRNWGELTLVMGAVLLRRWRRLKRVTALTTPQLAVESAHQGTPALLDGEFHMLPQRNDVVFDPNCGLVWGPRERTALS